VVGGSGNDLASFSNQFADTYSTATTLATNYTNPTLTGTTAINGTGNANANANANTITGNSAVNQITGGAGIDKMVLTAIFTSSPQATTTPQQKFKTPAPPASMNCASHPPPLAKSSPSLQVTPVWSVWW
jgi:hypothetical protein